LERTFWGKVALESSFIGGKQFWNAAGTYFSCILERSWNAPCGNVGKVVLESSFGMDLFGGKLPWKAVLERSWNLLFGEESCILERSWNALLAGAGVSTKLHSN